MENEAFKGNLNIKKKQIYGQKRGCWVKNDPVRASNQSTYQLHQARFQLTVYSLRDLEQTV